MLDVFKIVLLCLAGVAFSLLSLFVVSLFHRAFIRHKLFVLLGIVCCIVLWTLSSPQNGSLFLWILRLATLIYIVATIIVIFCSELSNRLIVWVRLFTKAWANDTHIFWGESSNGLQLAKSICGGKSGFVNSTKIAFVIPTRRTALLSARNDSAIAQVSKAGFLWLFSSDANYKCLARAGYHYFTGDKSFDNVLGATRLIRALQKIGKPQKLTVYVSIDSIAKDDLITRWADGINKSSSNVEVVLIRRESLIAKKFLLEHPMLLSPGIRIHRKTATVNGDFAILLIGFGVQGKILLNDLVCDAQCSDRQGNRVTLSVDVVDKDETTFGWFAANCKPASERFGLSFMQSDTRGKRFYEWLDSKIAERPWNRVVVCTGDDTLNISIAQDIVRLYRVHDKPFEGVVFAKVCAPHIKHCLNIAYGTDAFATFGSEPLGDVLKVLDKWDRGAMMLNWEYSRNREEAPEATWLKTSFANRESSRAAFFGMRNVLRLVGYEICEQGNCRDYNALNDPVVLGTLAETEHLRWMAYLLMQGICVWKPKREALLEMARISGEQITPNAIQLRNKHAALVEYGELPSVDELFNGLAKTYGTMPEISLQQRDMVFIQTAVAAIEKAGLSIRRLPNDCQ